MADSICVKVVMLTMDDTYPGDVQGDTQHNFILVLHVCILLVMCTLRLSLVLHASAASSFAIAASSPKGAVVSQCSGVSADSGADTRW